MRNLKVAPVGEKVLVKSNVFRRQRGSLERVHAGFKIGEAVLTVDEGWQWSTGVDGEVTTELCQPVGWWPLPGNESNVVDLSIIPKGWFLYGLSHNHTPIRFRGEVHKPVSKCQGGDEWTARLQRLEGGLLTSGHGPNPRTALQFAVLEVDLRNVENGGGR